MTSNIVSVQLKGGLGNQLFQLGFLEYIVKKTGRTPKLSTRESPYTGHSNENYFNSIFRNWNSMYSSLIAYSIRKEADVYDLHAQGNIIYDGYFQDYKYMDEIRDTFINKLVFNKDILSKYLNIQNKIFIHVRGGDYLSQCKSLHYIDLEPYYKNCIDLCNSSEFVIFTNDSEYANNLFGSKYPIINESEINTLYLMSQCKGAICANSSFSWWGAYLNPTRPIFMPSKWYNNHEYGNYYFNGVTVVKVGNF